MYRHPEPDEMQDVMSNVHWFLVDRCSCGGDFTRARDHAPKPAPDRCICWFSDEGEMCGFVAWDTDNIINYLYVSGMCRHHGVGTKLLLMAIQQIGDSARVKVLPDWEDSIEFLSKFGFGEPVHIMHHTQWTPMGRTPEDILKHLRQTAMFSLDQLAEEARLPVDTVKQAELDISKCSVGDVAKLARAYNVSAGYILTPEMP